MTTQESTRLSPQLSQQLCEQLNNERPDDLLLYAHVFGKQSGAKSARVVDLHEDSMDLELEFLYTTPKRLNIRFSTPLTDEGDPELHFDLLAKKAHDILGHNSNESIGRTIFKLLPEWLKH